MKSWMSIMHSAHFMKNMARIMKNIRKEAVVRPRRLDEEFRLDVAKAWLV